MKKVGDAVSAVPADPDNRTVFDRSPGRVRHWRLAKVTRVLKSQHLTSPREGLYA